MLQDIRTYFIINNDQMICETKKIGNDIPDSLHAVEQKLTCSCASCPCNLPKAIDKTIDKTL